MSASGDRRLEQTATVLFPKIGSELGRRGEGRANALRQGVTIKRSMTPVAL